MDSIIKKDDDELYDDYNDLIKDYSPLSLVDIHPDLFPNGKYIQLSAYGEKAKNDSVTSRDISLLSI